MATMNRLEVRRRQVARVPQPASMWPWIIQRVTGVVLVVLLAVHIGVEHFGNLNKPGVREGQRELIAFSDVAYRLAGAFWWVIDVALLVFVLFHGLNGIRNIAIDAGVKPNGSGDKLVTSLLSIIGFAAFGFGIAALVGFRKYA